MRESKTDTGRVEKAGCVPVRRTPSGVWEVLVVESRWTTDTWLFPKGSVEDGETSLAAAKRETIEEAGVMGDTTVRLGSWVIPTRNTSRATSRVPVAGTATTAGTASRAGARARDDASCSRPAASGNVPKRPQRLQMWLLAVSVELNHQDCRWIEASQRRRRWVSFAKARLVLATSQRPELLQMLDAAHGAVNAGRLICAPLARASPRTHQPASRLSV